MPKLENLQRSDLRMTAAARAADAWQRIQDKPTSITIRRNGTAQTAQTVRIEFDDTATERITDNVSVGLQTLIVFGVRGHATVTDTDIKPGDKFIAAKKEYEVLSLIHTTGEIQAIARATA
jgi:hypothetical protein